MEGGIRPIHGPYSPPHEYKTLLFLLPPLRTKTITHHTPTYATAAGTARAHVHPKRNEQWRQARCPVQQAHGV